MILERPLRSGETLNITVLSPGEGRGDTEVNHARWWFTARPFDPWMSATEQEFLARFLAGTADTSLRDWVFVGELEGAIVANAWHGTGSQSAEIGGYGFVLTDPAHRGKGIAQALTACSVDAFWENGGKAIYLGTGNPIAQRVYEKSGYRSYNGIAMRALCPGTDPVGFDAAYFAHDGPARVRDATLGDLGGYTALLLAHEPRDWIVRDFTETIFHAPPAVQATGSLRPFFSTIYRRQANPANQFKLLATPRGRVVGAAAVAAPSAGALAGVGTLEMQCYPTYREELAGLLEATLEAARGAGIRQVRAHAASSDRTQALRDAGFAQEKRLSSVLTTADGTVDVHQLCVDLR